MKRNHLIALGLLIIMILSACASRNTAPAQSPAKNVAVNSPQQTAQPNSMTSGNRVTILGNEGFSPSRITVKKSSTVTWKNEQDVKVTLTFFRNGQFYKNSDVVEVGGTWQFLFNEAGDYEYWSVDYGMKGHITVS